MPPRAAPLGEGETALFADLMDKLDYDGQRGPYLKPTARKQKILRRIQRSIEARFGTRRTTVQLKKKWSDMKYKRQDLLSSIRRQKTEPEPSLHGPAPQPVEATLGAADRTDESEPEASSSGLPPWPDEPAIMVVLDSTDESEPEASSSGWLPWPDEPAIMVVDSTDETELEGRASCLAPRVKEPILRAEKSSDGTEPETRASCLAPRPTEPAFVVEEDSSGESAAEANTSDLPPWPEDQSLGPVDTTDDSHEDEDLRTLLNVSMEMRTMWAQLQSLEQTVAFITARMLYRRQRRARRETM